MVNARPFLTAGMGIKFCVVFSSKIQLSKVDLAILNCLQTFDLWFVWRYAAMTFFRRSNEYARIEVTYNSCDSTDKLNQSTFDLSFDEMTICPAFANWFAPNF